MSELRPSAPASLSRPLTGELELMTRVASMYYTDGRTQDEIASALGLSRPTVGRVLSRARTEGVVTITVNVHPAMSLPLETELMSRFDLRHAHLAGDQTEEGPRRTAVGLAAARFVSGHLPEGGTVAVGMGRNVAAIPEAVESPAPHRTVFVSAIGGSPHIDQRITSNDLAGALAEAYGGSSAGIYAPAYADSVSVRDAFLAHEDVRDTLDRARAAAMAIVGIGDARDDSAVVRMGCISPAEMTRLRAAGAVGDVLGSFFDARGRPVGSWMADRVVAIGREDLRRIPLVLAVVSEPKAAALLGALRTGCIDALVTTVANAHELLALAAAESAAPRRRGAAGHRSAG